MNQLDVWIDDESLGGSALVGRLQRATSRTGEALSFEYDPQWLANAGPVSAFPLDHELFFGSGAQYARTGTGELSGAFVDCSPDRWGKRLMDRREAIDAREQGRAIRNLRAWDYLLGVYDESRMGALRLLDPQTVRYMDDGPLSAPPVTELRQLEAIADQVERGEDDDSDQMIRWVRQLLAISLACRLSSIRNGDQT